MNWKTRLISVALCAAACSHGEKIDVTKPPTGDAAKNASVAYTKGLQEMKDQNFMEATGLFEYVRANFPYSQYAALAELALADMAYDRDDYAQAAAAYQDFVKAHPSHPKADYAAFRVGFSYYQDKPSDWWFLPPSYERDQTPVKQALDAWNKFVLNYPKSELVTRARDLLTDCRQRLMAHDRYVAGFYQKHDAWKGAAGRWLAIADSYGDLESGKVRGEALWNAASAWRNGNDPADERTALQRLVQESPRDPRRAQAEQLLKQIPADARPPPLTPPARTDTSTPSPPVPPVKPPDEPPASPLPQPQPAVPQPEK